MIPRENNYRLHGKPPYSAVLVHGGPGARGELLPVAETLSASFGVIEAFQTAESIIGLITELHIIIQRLTEKPPVLIGHSWGAWLVWLCASRYPDSARKIVLVGSGPFLAKYTEGMMETRFSRLNDEDRLQCALLTNQFNTDPTAAARFGKLIRKADTFDEIPGTYYGEEFDNVQYDKIWPEAEQLRADGRLLDAGRSIHCPVTAIHGDYDPHPSDGVRIPLTGIFPDFRFIPLKDCGHSPWIEKHAREKFFDILNKEIME